MFTRRNFPTIFLAISVVTFPSCCANRLSDDDVRVVLRIIENVNPNLVRIVHDSGSDMSKVVSRIVGRITDNDKRVSAIPINIDPFLVRDSDETKDDADSLTSLLQNYTSVTVFIAADNSNDSIDAIITSIDKRLHRKHLNKYLVIFQTTLNVSSEESMWTKRVFEMFWECRVLDVVLVYRDDSSLRLKTFNPFQLSRELNVIALAVNATVNELFASKVLNLNGYEMNIFALDVIFILVRKSSGVGFEGVDGNMIEFFGRK